MSRALFVYASILAGAAILSGCGKGSAPDVAAKKETTFVSIGTGGKTGVYFPTGGFLKDLINAKASTYQIRAKVESTNGSAYNVNAVMRGEFEFGIAQSDIQHNAYSGLGEWQDKPQTDLRSVFSIHPELVSLISADDAGIESVRDLKGKRVNIGAPGSGNRRNAIDALESVGLNFETDIHAEQIKASDAPVKVQDRQIDAFFYTVGHPNGAIKEATAGKRKVHFVPITEIAELLEKFPFYVTADIPLHQYPSATNTGSVSTFGVKATLVTSAAVADDIVYAMTKEVFENFDKFKTLHPAYGGLTKGQMLEGLSAPVHPGAMKYYKEAGLKK